MRMRFVGPHLVLDGALILADLHLGLEDRNAGSRGLILRSDAVLARLSDAMKTTGAHRVVFDGDVLDDFALSRIESRIAIGRALRSFVKAHDASFIRGNHDPMLASLGLEVHDSLMVGDVLVTHGDRMLEDVASEDDLRAASGVVIGHEHPAVTITDSIRSERFKCFVRGRIMTALGEKELIILPCAHPDLLGSDIGSWRSPIIPSDFDGEVIVAGDEPRFFGSVRSFTSQ